MTEHIDPNYPYFLLGLVTFLLIITIWIHFDGRKIDKEYRQNVSPPRKDIRKWDLEGNKE